MCRLCCHGLYLRLFSSWNLLPASLLFSETDELNESLVRSTRKKSFHFYFLWVPSDFLKQQCQGFSTESYWRWQPRLFSPSQHDDYQDHYLRNIFFSHYAMSENEINKSKLKAFLPEKICVDVFCYWLSDFDSDCSYSPYLICIICIYMTGFEL